MTTLPTMIIRTMVKGMIATSNTALMPKERFLMAMVSMMKTTS